MAGTPTTGQLYSGHELRIISAAWTEVFLAASAAGWTPDGATIRKIRLLGDVDDSALKHEAIGDASAQTRRMGGNPPFPGRRSNGPLKFVHPFGGGNVDHTVDITSYLLSKAMGGIASPTAKTSAIIAGSTTTTVNATGIGAKVVPGMGALVGARGDTRSGGALRPIASEAADAITLGLALPGAPSTADTVTLAQTMYFTEAETLAYIQALWLSRATQHQRQAVGGVLSFGVDGLGVNQDPKINFEMLVADHQWVPSGERTTQTHATAPEGNDPPTNLSLAGLWIGDASGTANTAYRGGDVKINPGIAWQHLEDNNGVNRCGGWMRLAHNVTFEVTLPIAADHPGLADDFLAGTSKKVMLQYGMVNQGCVGFYFPKAYVDGDPIPVKWNNEAAIKVAFRAVDNYDATSEILSSAMVVYIL